MGFPNAPWYVEDAELYCTSITDPAPTDVGRQKRGGWQETKVAATWISTAVGGSRHGRAAWTC